MFIEKKIIFGHGTVAVGADIALRILTLEYVKPPSPVGSTMTQEEYEAKTSHGKVFFNYKDDMKDLRDKLKEVSEENPLIEFRGYTFDFSLYNPESVNVVKRTLAKVMRGSTLVLAC